MPFTKGQSDDLSPLRDLAYGWGKIVSRRAYGEEGPGLDLDFDSIESLAVDLGQAVTQGTIDSTLSLTQRTPSRESRHREALWGIGSGRYFRGTLC